MVDKEDIERLREIFVTRKECNASMKEVNGKLTIETTKPAVIETRAGLKNGQYDQMTGFFRHSTLLSLEIHKVFLRLRALIGEINPRPWANAIYQTRPKLSQILWLLAAIGSGVITMLVKMFFEG